MNTSKEITVQIKNRYGNDLIYPVCDNAKIFAKMLGQNTLTSTNIAAIRALGYVVKTHSEVV